MTQAQILLTREHYNISTAAEMLERSPHTIRSRMQRGNLGQKVGKEVVIPTEVIMQMFRDYRPNVVVERYDTQGVKIY